METITSQDVHIESLRRLSRDLKAASATLAPKEVRYLVDAYYQMQENRKVADNQIRALAESNEPHEVIGWLSSNASTLERNIKAVLDAHTSSTVIGRWAKSITGIGPVIAAGLAAHIDLEPWKCAVAREDRTKKACRADEPCSPRCGTERIMTVGHIWRFAGLDPTVVWDKGQKRPWNASLKVLCWKIGESFVKVSNHKDDVYGHLWRERKTIEEVNNATGLYAEQAKLKLERFRIGKNTDAYKAYSTGSLPPAHIHARAKRWAVKLFLAHWHAVAFETRYGVKPPKPYILTRELGDHVHEILPPNWPMK